MSSRGSARLFSIALAMVAMLIAFVIALMPTIASADEGHLVAGTIANAGTSLKTQSSGTNDTLSRAAVIPVDYSKTSTITNKTQKRYYAFDVKWSGKVRFNATSWIKDATEYTLYDKKGNQIHHWITWRDSTTGRATFAKTFDLTRGRYYISIGSGDGGAGNYSFKLQFTSAKETYAEFAGNPNNDTWTSVKETKGISFGKTVNGQIAINDPKDFYKFTVKWSGKITLKLASWLDGSTRVYLYNQQGYEIRSVNLSRNNTNGRADITVPLDLARGTYYLCVSRSSSDTSYTYVGDNGNYRFKLSYASAKETLPDYWNDTDGSFNQARSIAFNKTYYEQVALNGDVDYYKFKLDRASNVSFKLTSWIDNEGKNDSSSITYLYLYDNDGNRVHSWLYSRKTVSGRTTISDTKTLDPGTYRICVKSNGSKYMGNYQLRISK